MITETECAVPAEAPETTTELWAPMWWAWMPVLRHGLRLCCRRRGLPVISIPAVVDKIDPNKVCAQDPSRMAELGRILSPGRIHVWAEGHGKGKADIMVRGGRRLVVIPEGAF